jgi:hypothetical protein
MIVDVDRTYLAGVNYFFLRIASPIWLPNAA